MENLEKNLGGRPSKLNEKFLKAAEKVLNDNINAIILTDAELFELINLELEDKDKICYTSFKNYKAKSNFEEQEEYQRFLSIYKKALILQKKSLFDSLKNDPQGWQRYAWIIERKFSDWNLKSIQEIKQTTNLTISDEAKAFIKELEGDDEKE